MAEQDADATEVGDMRRFWGRLRMWSRSETGRAALAAGVMLAGIAIAAALIVPEWSWKNVGPIKDMAGGMQSALTVLAIVVGGAFALVKLQVFRTFEPHLTITHEVNHRAISPNYIHIDATARLRNSSLVKIELRRADVRLHLVAPITDDEAEVLYDAVFEDKIENYVQWPVTHEMERYWDDGDLIIEPGATHLESFDFIIPGEIESVRVYTYFHNPTFEEGSNVSEGWRTSTAYDILRQGSSESISG